jgi:thiopurine S-methyltransferase
MKSEFWLERWQRGEIGFHQPQFNNYLTEYWQLLGLAGSETVFVPLCGKSLDLLWLRQQGHTVVGIELSDQAVLAFWEENALECLYQPAGAFINFQGDGISLLVGDYFQLTQETLKGVTAVFDRAALIALPPEMRPVYVEQMAQLLPSGAQVLLMTMEYPQHEMAGPPFSVAEAEVIALYSPHFEVQQLASFSTLDDNARFRQRGLTALTEKVWRLRRY